jgi:hypothetical protein
MRLRATLFLATSTLFASAAPSLAAEPAKSAVPVPASKPAPRRPAPKAAAPAAPALPPPDVALDLEPAAKGNLWTLRVKNKGSLPLRVVTDPRLVKITFPPAESPAAGKPKKAPKPIVCALPDDARPWGDGEARVLLPGKTYAQKFDVRMLCFGEAAAAALETATHFSASYGFPVPRGALVPPFVVGPVDGLEPTVANAKEISLGDHELTHAQPAQPATGATGATGATPQSGSSKNDPGKPSDELPPPKLTLTQTARVDSGTAEYAQITVNLKNESSRPVTLAFRPQTVSFEVTSPSGRRTTCGTPGMTGIGRELLTTLGKDRQSALTLAIGRICPDGTFDERGLYAVSAKVDTRRTSVSGGESLSLYSGAVTTDKPTWLRVRTGRAPAVAELRPTFD